MSRLTTNASNTMMEDCYRIKRSFNDKACLVIYSMFLLVWVCIAIYAFSHSNSSPLLTFKGVLSTVVYGLFYKIDLFFLWCSCTVLVVLYYIVLQRCTKIALYLTVFLKFLVMSWPIVVLFTPLIVHPFIVITVLCFLYAIFWIEIEILRKVGIDAMCRVIVDACRVSKAAFPSSLLVAFLLFFTTTLLSIFTGSVIYCLSNFNRHYEFFFNNLGFIIIFLICSIWILLANYFCMLSVLHGMFTSWCRIKNSSTIPNFNVTLQRLFLAYRYQMGSFAYMSAPIVPIILMVQIIGTNIQEWQKKFKESHYNVYSLIIIIISTIINTSVTCASYGKSCYPSMKDSFQVIIQNPMKFAAIRLITAWMIIFGLFLIPMITIGLTTAYALTMHPFDYGIYIAVVGSVSLVVTSGILFIFSAAIDSVLFCHLEELSGKSKCVDRSSEDLKIFFEHLFLK